MSTTRWSDGEAAYSDALRAFAEQIAKTDSTTAAELVASAYGSADEVKAAANMGLIRAVLDRLCELHDDPETVARAADLSPQVIGRVYIAVEGIDAELAELEPSQFRLSSAHRYTDDPEPPTKPILTAYQAAVLLCVSRGYESKQIAELRGLKSEKAINATLKRCRELLGARTTTAATHIARDAGEFSYFRRNANHTINRAGNRTREQIEKDEWAASIWREQMKLREEGFHKQFYRSGDARSRSPLDELPGEQPNATHPEEATANPGIDTHDHYQRRLTRSERRDPLDDLDDSGATWGRSKKEQVPHRARGRDGQTHANRRST
jgi:DNA-binding NarL/FixJ family response regulator